MCINIFLSKGINCKGLKRVEGLGVPYKVCSVGYHGEPWKPGIEQDAPGGWFWVGSIWRAHVIAAHKNISLSVEERENIVKEAVNKIPPIALPTISDDGSVGRKEGTPCQMGSRTSPSGEIYFSDGEVVGAFPVIYEGEWGRIKKEKRDDSLVRAFLRADEGFFRDYPETLLTPIQDPNWSQSKDVREYPCLSSPAGKRLGDVKTIRKGMEFVPLQAFSTGLVELALFEEKNIPEIQKLITEFGVNILKFFLERGDGIEFIRGFYTNGEADSIPSREFWKGYEAMEKKEREFLPNPSEAFNFSDPFEGEGRRLLEKNRER